MDQLPPDPLDELTEADLASQRHGSRDSLLLTAQLRLADGTEETVRVRNLSSGGLMAEYIHPVAQGSPVKVAVRGLGWIDGRVAWAAEGRIGIAFEHEVNPMAARKPVAPGRPAPAPRPVRRAV
jgi:hypothetical protein